MGGALAEQARTLGITSFPCDKRLVTLHRHRRTRKDANSVRMARPVVKLDRPLGVILVGVILFLLFGWWATQHSFASAGAIAAKLERRANEALMTAGLGFASVEMRGQRAVVTGAPPDPGARKRVLALVRASTWGGGRALGGVTRVDDRMAPAEGPARRMWSAVRTPGRITLAGDAPSPAAREALVRQARALFPTIRVVDDMSITPTAPPAPGSDAGAIGQADWFTMARFGIDHIRDLPDGEAIITDSSFVLRGTARNTAEVKALTADMSAISPKWTWENAVVAPLEIPEISGIDLSDASQEACQESLKGIMAQNTITFETGKAVLTSQSVTVLEKLVWVAKRCQSFRIDISGHTDNVGSRAVNMALSRARAQAVGDYLVAQGVSRDRLTIQGLGPDRPAASNATPAGQARNRRIEFTVRT